MTKLDEIVAMPLMAALACVACADTTPHQDAASTPPKTSSAQQAIVQNHDVYVDQYGRFSPMWTYVDSGDTVTWHFYDRQDSVVPRAWSGPWPAICDSDEPYDPTDPNDFTGPMPRGASGVFVMGPKDAEADPATWQSADNRGVFIRLGWSAIDGGPNWASDPSWTAGQRYDWSVLDHEMDEAVANGKMFSVGVKAGIHKTPEWIFQTDANGVDRGALGGGVTRLALHDENGYDPLTATCGTTFSLGNPAEQTYRDHYNDMLTALGDHIRSKRAWYRHLSYVKLSGANYITHENRLPKECISGCICNPEVFSTNGYTPSGLETFYLEQAATIASAFPGKTMGYMLIQAGFPRVSDTGDYEGVGGVTVDVDGDPTTGLPTGTEQTESVIAALQDQYFELVTVAHNGLSTGPSVAYGPCVTNGVHPVGAGPYDAVGSGCPNRWVLGAGYRTRSLASPWDTLTGFQTVNPGKGVFDGPTLEQAFQNEWDSSDGIYLEIYEALGLSLNGAVLDSTASGRTIGDWSDELDARRRNDWSASPELPEPYPLTHSHTFVRTLAGAGNEIYHYVHPTKCGIDYASSPGTELQYGAVVILP